MNPDNSDELLAAINAQDLAPESEEEDLVVTELSELILQHGVDDDAVLAYIESIDDPIMQEAARAARADLSVILNISGKTNITTGGSIVEIDFTADGMSINFDSWRPDNMN